MTRVLAFGTTLPVISAYNRYDLKISSTHSPKALTLYGQDEFHCNLIVLAPQDESPIVVHVHPWNNDIPKFAFEAWLWSSINPSSGPVYLIICPVVTSVLLSALGLCLANYLHRGINQAEWGPNTEYSSGEVAYCLCRWGKDSKVWFVFRQNFGQNLHTRKPIAQCHPDDTKYR